MSQIRIADLPARMQAPSDTFGATLPADRIVLSGSRIGTRLPSGFTLTLQEACAEADFETRALRPANVLLHLVLDGQVDANIAGDPLHISREAGKPVQLVMSALSEPAPFQRRVRKGQTLRKLSVVIEWGWLETRGVSKDAAMGGERHRVSSWAARSTDMLRAEHLFKAGLTDDHPAPDLQVASEALGFSLIEQAIEGLMTLSHTRNAKQREQLARMEQFGCRPGPMPHLSEIAAMGGMSVSSLRRLFHTTYGQTVHERLRDLRLDHAAEELAFGTSVAQAAHIAGYASPTAFATAFRRKTGLAPSQISVSYRPSEAAMRDC
ncbi:helix-turn-helix transcriptional regulator [Celeribacter sp. ULVN23_4]